jgi:hypothetical protein
MDGLNAIGDFLKNNPNEVVLVGFSNIGQAFKVLSSGVPDKAATEAAVLKLLESSSLFPYVTTTALEGNATLQDLINSNQRAVMMFYSDWSSPPHTSGTKVIKCIYIQSRRLAAPDIATRVAAQCCAAQTNTSPAILRRQP